MTLNIRSIYFGLNRNFFSIIEGVHQDGTEISSVTLVNLHNVRTDIGSESRIWTLDQPIGNYNSTEFGKLDGTPAEGFSWDKCIFNKMLTTPWETVLFNDRMVKHEVRAFLQKDETRPSHRDVIISFLRKPHVDGSDKKLVEGEDGEMVELTVY